MYIKHLLKSSRDLLVKMLRNPAGERNKQPILETIQSFIGSDAEGNFLEISSGVGLHISYIAPHFPKITFQPSEYEIGMFKSIKAYSENQSNILEPIFVDISKDFNQLDSKFKDLPLKDCTNTFDYMLNINMIHISEWKCTEGLFKNASILLKPQGILFTYGPYSQNKILTPESNVSFDKSLRAQNPAWGIRDINNDLKKLAEENFDLIKICDLPSNNKLLVWKKK